MINRKRTSRLFLFYDIIFFHVIDTKEIDSSFVSLKHHKLFHQGRFLFIDVGFRGAKNMSLWTAANAVAIPFSGRVHFVTDVVAPRGNATLLWYISISSLNYNIPYKRRKMRTH